MNITVVGENAIALTCAALLTYGGHDTTLICPAEQALAVDGSGITLIYRHGSKNIAVKTVASPAYLTGECDICFLASEMPAALKDAAAIKKYMAADGAVVSLQNGMMSSPLASVIGADMLIDCMMTWLADKKNDTTAVITADGDFYVGRSDGAITDKVKQVCRMMNCIFPSALTDNINGHKFSRLIMNCCMTSVGVLCGLSVSAVVGLPQARKIMIAAARECMDVAEAMDINVENYADRINFYRFLNGDTFVSRCRRNFSLRFAVRKFRRATFYGQTLLSKHEPTEVGYYNGWLVEKAKQYGVAVPVNTRIVEMVHEAENRVRRIMLENLYDESFIDRQQ